MMLIFILFALLHNLANAVEKKPLINDTDFGDYIVHRDFRHKYRGSFWETIGNFLGMYCGGVPRYENHKIKPLKDLWQIASHANRSRVIDPQRETPKWFFEKDFFKPYFIKFFGGIHDKDAIVRRDTDPKWFLTYTWNTILCELTEYDKFVTVVYEKVLESDVKMMFDLTDLLTHYYLCIGDMDIINNCPGACNGKKNPCELLQHNDGTCTSYLPDQYIFSVRNVTVRKYEKDIKDRSHNYRVVAKEVLRIKDWTLKLPADKRIKSTAFRYAYGEDVRTKIDINMYFQRFVKLQKLFVMETHCRCQLGYVYDPEAKICKSEMDKLLCGSGNPCKNGGACARRILPNGTKTDEVQCRCHPAFQGQYCERKRNPCRHEKALCGKFPCIRDEVAAPGFRCRCPRGYKTKSSHQPQCEDEDDCLTPNTCQNGGTCVNLRGTFDCKCRKGFEGFRCEIPPPPPNWSVWAEWSDCREPEPSKICSELPFQEQFRTCQVNIIQQRCLGPRRRIRYGCKGKEMVDTNLICGKDASETKSLVAVNYAVKDDAGDEEFDPPIVTRNMEILPSFKDTFFYTVWLALIFIQVYVVWLWSTLIVDFIRPKE